MKREKEREKERERENPARMDNKRAHASLEHVAGGSGN